MTSLSEFFLLHSDFEARIDLLPTEKTAEKKYALNVTKLPHHPRATTFHGRTWNVRHRYKCKITKLHKKASTLTFYVVYLEDITCPTRTVLAYAPTAFQHFLNVFNGKPKFEKIVNLFLDTVDIDKNSYDEDDNDEILGPLDDYSGLAVANQPADHHKQHYDISYQYYHYHNHIDDDVMEPTNYKVKNESGRFEIQDLSDNPKWTLVLEPDDSQAIWGTPVSGPKALFNGKHIHVTVRVKDN